MTKKDILDDVYVARAMNGVKFRRLGRQSEQGREVPRHSPFITSPRTPDPRAPCKHPSLLGLTRKELLSNKRVSCCLRLLISGTSWQGSYVDGTWSFFICCKPQGLREASAPTGHRTLGCCLDSIHYCETPMGEEALFSVQWL